jgi:hypothetical protein
VRKAEESPPCYICCQETASEDCNRLRTLFCVSDLSNVVPSGVCNPISNPYPVYSHIPIFDKLVTRHMSSADPIR